MSIDCLDGRIIFNKYLLLKKIGEGAFGQIYLSQYIANPNEKYAIKLENKTKGQDLLENEAYILNYLKGVGIPQVKSFGLSLSNNVLVMELLGVSLSSILKKFKKFSLKTICLLAVQFLNRIEFIHNKHIIHRDIKPDNFTIGEKDPSTIYLIDFGLAKQYRSSKTLKHVEFKNHKRLTGTARYASINALNGFEQSRRDDLEAIGYVLVYLYKGSLPWQGLRILNGEDRYKKISKCKSSISPQELCYGMPIEFALLVDYARKLEYEQEPDYNYLRHLIFSVINKQGYEFDNMFDWIKSENLSYSIESSTKLERSNIKVNLFYEHQFNTIYFPDSKNSNNNIGTNCNAIKQPDKLNTKNIDFSDSIKLYEYIENSSYEKKEKNLKITKKIYDSNYKFIESINKNCELLRRIDITVPRKLGMKTNINNNYTNLTLTISESLNKNENADQNKKLKDCVLV